MTVSELFSLLAMGAIAVGEGALLVLVVCYCVTHGVGLPLIAFVLLWAVVAVYLGFRVYKYTLDGWKGDQIRPGGRRGNGR